MERCECGFVWDQVGIGEVTGRLSAAAGRLRALLTSGGDVLGRPSPGRWSGLEYAGHVRDVTLSLRERIIAGLASPTPDPGSMFPAFRVDEGLYRADTVEWVVADLAVALSLFTRLIDGVGVAVDDAWGRRLVYPWPSPAQRTLSWVAAHVVHEWEHHGDDIADNLARGRVPLFHLVFADEWRDASPDADLTWSTRGRTLEQEGFIHLCTATQLDGVVDRFYSDVVDDLLLLELDPVAFPAGALCFEVAGDSAFPHLYASLPRDAVRSVAPLRP